jgi:hypothetical protein
MRSAIIAIGIGALGLAGCVDRQGGITGTQSIGVELLRPASPGDVQNRLPDGTRDVEINLTAYDADYQVDTSFEREVQVYVQYLGTLTPTLGVTPLAKLRMTAGRAVNQTVVLPLVFGPTTLWIDDGQNPTPTYATGTSPTLWFRDPYIADLQAPVDERVEEAMYISPLQNKQVSVTTSRYGALGKLVVTSVFAQGYTVSDVSCSDASGTPPCVAMPYDHTLVFSFSAPRDQNGGLLRQCQLIDGFAGGIQEFNGLTEVGFPATFASRDDVDLGRLPAPVVFDRNTWFEALSNPQGSINFERHEAGAIQVNNATVCNLDSAYVTFKQWKLDPAGNGGDCSRNRRVINVITTGVINDLDPATLVGKTLPRVVGIVRPVQGSNSNGPFNIWIIYPRSSADLTLPP